MLAKKSSSNNHTKSPKNSTSNDYQSGSYWRNLQIRTRESLLDKVVGGTGGVVLNGQGIGTSDGHGADLAAEIKMFLDEVKYSAIDETGFRIDYSRLRHDTYYEKYRYDCSPKLRNFDPNTLVTTQEKIAFWVNLYNAIIIDAVIAFGVSSSVTQGRFGLLSFFRRAAYEVGGDRVSCDDIEHGILRGNRGHPFLPGKHFQSHDSRINWIISKPDVRIHFALNCASLSCPPVRAYTADSLNSQLQSAARNFVDLNVKVEQERNVVVTSEIFHWFAKDFGGERGIIDFILQHLPGDERNSWITINRYSAKLKYERYDWGLNSF